MGRHTCAFNKRNQTGIASQQARFQGLSGVELLGFQDLTGPRNECKSQAINYRKPFSNVTSMEPVVFVDSFSGLLRVVKIAFEYARTLKANLRRRQTIDTLISSTSNFPVYCHLEDVVSILILIGNI